MPRPITRYQCVHCNKKVYANKSRTARHERECFYNPENKSCITCKNMTDDEHGAFCEVHEKEVLVHGSPIKNCEAWQEITYDDYEEFA